jgi:hypothetical protein
MAVRTLAWIFHCGNPTYIEVTPPVAINIPR